MNFDYCKMVFIKNLKCYERKIAYIKWTECGLDNISQNRMSKEPLTIYINGNAVVLCSCSSKSLISNLH